MLRLLFTFVLCNIKAAKRNYFSMLKFKSNPKNKVDSSFMYPVALYHKKKNPYWIFSCLFYYCFFLFLSFSLSLFPFSPPPLSLPFSPFLIFNMELRKERSKEINFWLITPEKVHDLEVPVSNSFEYLQQSIDNK